MNKGTISLKIPLVVLVKNCPTVSYQVYTLHPPPSLYKVQKYLQIANYSVISH